MTGTVYFLREGERGAVKIGYTTMGVSERVQRLQSGNPRELRVLAHKAAGRTYEQRLKARFASVKIRGEWFRPTPELLNLALDIALGEEAEDEE